MPAQCGLGFQNALLQSYFRKRPVFQLNGAFDPIYLSHMDWSFVVPIGEPFLSNPRHLFSRLQDRVARANTAKASFKQDFLNPHLWGLWFWGLGEG